MTKVKGTNEFGDIKADVVLRTESFNDSVKELLDNESVKPIVFVFLYEGKYSVAISDKVPESVRSQIAQKAVGTVSDILEQYVAQSKIKES